jgi:hypothetical protein
MSYDIKLQNACDHKIMWIKEDLLSDYKTVNLRYPVSSIASFKVRINGQIVPLEAYSISTYKDNLTAQFFSRINFTKKIKLYNPIIECYYNTYQERCPKCLGVGLLDDIFINGKGDIEVVSKENLLLQNVEKIIITKISSNIFHDWYGTGLHTFIGTKIFDKDLLFNKIREQISVAIEKLRNIQRQMVSSGRKFDNGELFGKLLKIEIKETEDPSLILINLIFTSQNNASIEYSQYLSLTNIRQRLAYSV